MEIELLDQIKADPTLMSKMDNTKVMKQTDHTPMIFKIKQIIPKMPKP